MGDLVDIGAARVSRQKRELQARLTPVSDPRLYIDGTGGMTFPTECEGIVHHFLSLPGHCVCGENYWDGGAEELTPKPRS